MATAAGGIFLITGPFVDILGSWSHGSSKISETGIGGIETEAAVEVSLLDDSSDDCGDDGDDGEEVLAAADECKEEWGEK
jgi:hypothetical protein